MKTLQTFLTHKTTILVAKIVEKIVIYSAIIFLGLFFYKTDNIITTQIQKVKNLESSVVKFKEKIKNLDKGLDFHGKVIDGIGRSLK